ASCQIAIVAPSDVPLWKVIVGPRADKLTGPARVRFFFGPRFERTSFAHPVACARACRALLWSGFESSTEGEQWLGQPRPSLRSASGWKLTAICRRIFDSAPWRGP